MDPITLGIIAGALFGAGAVASSGGKSEESSSDSQANKGWSDNEDGSRSKTTSNESTFRTENISSRDYPHEHTIYRADKDTGKTEQVWVGENFEGMDGKRGK